MLNDGPHPEDPIYQAAARSLLEKIRQVCSTERERCGEVPESWPSEIRLFPAAPDTAEGVLYMPRAVPPVYIFQATAGQDEDGNISAHIHGLAPLTMEVLDLGLDYQKRASQYVFTCTCGHVIPKLMTFPIFIEGESDDEDDDENEDRRHGEQNMTSEEIRIQEMVHPDEMDYKCPACGFKPNKRYNS